MLPGIRGGLVSGYFAEHLLGQRFAGRLGERDRDEARRALARLTRSAAALGPASSVRTVFDVTGAPLAALLGFRVVAATPTGPAHLAALLECEGARVAMVVVPWASELDLAWRTGVLAGIDAAARWCLVVNGRELRLLDSWRSFSRDYVAFDLDLVAAEARSFAVFWALVRAQSLACRQAARPLLDAIVSLSRQHAVGVCRSLRHGVLEALAALLHGFANRPRPGSPPDALLEQSLTLVYRLLFLLFAEARRLMPTWNDVYSASYSVEALRQLAEHPGDRAHPGLWETFQAMSRLAHHGCRAGTLVVTPFNGRLFSPARTPLGDSARLADEDARKAIVALSTTRSPEGGGGRARIAYQDLGVEELGGVYESVLDYEPRFERAGRDVKVRLEPGSGRRKATGTFYTPRSLTTYLVRQTLHPLVHDRPPHEILGLRVVDPSMGSGAFLVAACGYLAAAYERALVAGGQCHPSDIDDRDRAHFRRQVAQRCLYGVDRNPTAVQLARLSLWLATLAADRPLTFLDHHLAAGDSLVGAAPGDVLRVPERGAASARRHDGHPTLFDLDEMRQDLLQVLPARIRVAEEPGDTLQAVREKERAIEGLARPANGFSRWKRAADFWCACWFLDRKEVPARGVYREATDAILAGGSRLSAATLSPMLERAAGVASAWRFFHWQLEFPEVFFDTNGAPLDDPGFDAVVGNPPWDMLRADAAADSDSASRTYDAGLLAFVRQSRVYVDQSDGHPNRFQLFVERAVQLARRRGRIGLVVPWGLFADHGCAGLRRRLLLASHTDSIVSFDNSKAIFPIHRSLRFALVTATTETQPAATRCRLHETDATALDAIEAGTAPGHFPLALSPALLERLSGEALSVPDVRTPLDLEILERVSATCPPLGAPAGWQAQFGRELNATDDRPHFVAAAPGAASVAKREEDLVVVEGKHLAPFVARLETARYRIPRETARRLLGGRGAFAAWRLAYRDVASATNRVTLIAAMLPPGCVSTHTVFCLKTRLDEQAQWFLCGVMNSYVANYLVRLRVTTHVSAGIVARLPVPFERPLDSDAFEVAQLARRLTVEERPEARDRLQAIVARLYGLTVAQYAHVLETFPLVERERREAALTLFADLSGRPTSHT